jgi:hypothetical protein
MAERFPCPKCNRLLAPSGELEVEGVTLPTYQCDECIKTVELFGKPFSAALTFAVKDGKAFDPAAADGVLRF